MAKKFFGTVRNAMGKSILYQNKVNLKVTAIFNDMPANSSMPFQIMISYQNFYKKNNENWNSVSSQIECYALLKK